MVHKDEARLALTLDNLPTVGQLCFVCICLLVVGTSSSVVGEENLFGPASAHGPTNAYGPAMPPTTAPESAAPQAHPVPQMPVGIPWGTQQNAIPLSGGAPSPVPPPIWPDNSSYTTTLPSIEPAPVGVPPYQPISYFDPNIDVTIPSVADPPVERPVADEDVSIVPAPGSAASAAKGKAARQQGPYQASLFTATVLGGNDLGMTTLDLRSIFAFPLPTEHSPLLLTPGYAWTSVSGPDFVDVPGQLHEAYFDIRYIKRFTPALAIDLGITPGLYSDFEGNHEHAFRLGARGLVAMTYSPTTQIVVGLAYLDREDVDFLPLGGIVWTPNDAQRLELVSPRPRYAQRWSKQEDREVWWYVAGEIGGGSWAVRRECGCSDVLNYYDLRAAFGLEFKNPQGVGGLFEAGYVFYRHLEYLSGGPVFEPDDTFVVRAGMTF